MGKAQKTDPSDTKRVIQIEFDTVCDLNAAKAVLSKEAGRVLTYDDTLKILLERHAKAG